MIRCGRHGVEHPDEEFPPSQRKGGGWCNLAYRERYTDNPVHQRANRNSRFKREYGITHDEYDALVARQGGGCAVCREVPSKQRLAVDHDHVTGRVRGACCDRCNRAIGLLRDSPAVAKQMADYLEASSD